MHPYITFRIAFITAVLILVIGCGDNSTGTPGQIGSVSHIATSPAIAKALFNINAVAGKGPADVEKELGKPSRKDTTPSHGKKLPKYFYRNEQVEVVYIDGRADWITVNFDGFGAMPDHSKSVLGLVGLPDIEPTFENPRFIIRWENKSGFKQINTGVGSGGKTAFLLLCYKTTPI